MTDWRSPYGFTWGPGVIYYGTTSAPTNILVVDTSAEERKAALDYKRFVSWCNMLDRMDESRHGRGAELLRLPDSKAMAPRRRAPSVGRVCAGSSRYRVLRPSA